MSSLGRRQLLAGLVATAACKSRAPDVEPPPPPVPPPLPSFAGGPALATYERHELALPGTVSPRVIVLAPRAVAGERYPVVIALHGRGEARKGPVKGPLGWPEDYALERALERIAHPPLTRADFFELVTPAELSAHNTALAATPYRGLVLLCPFLPDVALEDAVPQDAYGKFLVDILLPRARGTFAILPGREHTGVDGISLGGEVALHVGARHPETFGAVSGMQPAIQTKDAARWAARLVAAKKSAGTLAVRLLTSTGDPFRGPTRALSSELTKAGLEHTLTETPGPHDYVYNRGPAAFALLEYHDRVLR